MAEIVNLRTVRRRREREATAQAAADNRARFGRTKGQVESDRLDRAQADRVLDGARLDDPATEE